ncbi:MAG: RNA methyltransferase [Treponemataceae bacterium]
MDISIILCHPESSQNIGAICRAMKAMSINTLRIIGEKNDYIEQDIRRLSIHAFDVWENCMFFPNIEMASADCTLLAGTTRRRGKKRKEWLVFPEEFAEQIYTNTYERVGIVFGNERTGLTDAQLQDCTIGVQIPSDKNCGSLNLSHAVQIICYTLYRKMKVKSLGYQPVSLENIDDGIECIMRNLEKIGFFKLAGKDDMSHFWRSILSRSAVSQSELQYIEKLFSKCAGLIEKQRSCDSDT